jgi:hypothetical protein
MDRYIPVVDFVVSQLLQQLYQLPVERWVAQFAAQFTPFGYSGFSGFQSFKTCSWVSVPDDFWAKVRYLVEDAPY